MSKKIRSFIRCLSLILLINVIVSFNGANSYFMNLLNSLFLTSLICLMLGGTLLILGKGVLNNFFNSAKRFYESVMPLERYVSEKSQGSKYTSFPRFKTTYYLLFLGALLFFFTFFLSLIV